MRNAQVPLEIEEDPLEIQENPVESQGLPEMETVAENINDIPSEDNKDQEEVFSILGSRPKTEGNNGKSFHEEIVIRWNAYLKNGLSKDQREELMNKYMLPANCKALVPPQINNEIQPCLPKFANEHDMFMTALQEQLAHGLAAVGSVIDSMLPNQEQLGNVKILADACQLFTNVHHAISIHRRYKIMPHLNLECKKVAKTLEHDEFLFSKNFTEAVKNEQAVKRASVTFKKKTWQPSTLPGPSGFQAKQNYLNYPRPQYKGRFKEKRKEERRPTDRNRTRQTKNQKTQYYRK